MPMIPLSSLPAGALLLRRIRLLVILPVASIMLLGCVPSIEVVQPVSPLPAPTVTPAERGLAIMGVDFDPPLEAGQILASGGITLLVALENQGRRAEPVTTITARLYDPEAVPGTDLARETITVRSLAPGELRVVRFTQVNDLPVRPRYKLAVEVSPLPGEQEHDDNVRTYDILVHPSE